MGPNPVTVAVTHGEAALNIPNDSPEGAAWGVLEGL
jgi:hypothetical protein